MFGVDLGLAVFALTLALALRPWRMHGRTGPPWPTGALVLVLPLLWSLDRLGSPALPLLSGTPLLVLFAGWPGAVVLVVPAAGAAMALGHLGAADTLHRAVWLGLVPATFALAVGWVQRHVLPRHLFVYILVRAFIGTAVAVVAARAIDVFAHGADDLHGAFTPADHLLAALLGAFAEGTLTGMIVAIAVAFRPDWLATYSDRLYLPPRR